MRETILVAVDDSRASRKAVELLARYRGSPGKLAVALVNVQEPPLSIAPELAVDPAPLEDALRARGRELLEAPTRRLRSAGLRVTATVRLGFIVDEILREARAKSASLIVLGTRGHGVLQGFALGSVAMRVAHAGKAPVWLVNPDAALPRQIGRKVRVLLAVDGTQPALRAARQLARWRRWLGELDVQIAFVQQPLGYLRTVLPPHDDVMRQWSTKMAEKAAAAARRILAKHRIAHYLHITIGDPAQEIVHLADETACELIALGTRGRGALHHALVGSVALKTAVKAAVPVMLVP